MPPAIRVEGLSKRYRLGVGLRGVDNYRTLREMLSHAASRVVRSLQPHGPRAPGLGNGKAGPGDQFWALKDVSFEVQPGEVVGIIGRNGAGKSTLLKVLSRITEPTTGRVRLRGRVGSLLEVGTGFHPELTGRENIYLNGSILGMSRREITRKFDEIVAFAEVEKFLDTPVKRYSSGMYVRLAFAVAAHLEPEVLVVDEVLAVGDQAFQKKCAGKMQEVGRAGRTVLLVTHNMAAVESLCDRCVMLECGQLAADGEPTEVLGVYHRLGDQVSAVTRDLAGHQGRLKGMTPVMGRVTLTDDQGAAVSSIRMGGSLTVGVDFDLTGLMVRPVLGLVIKTDLGGAVFGTNNRIVSGHCFDIVSAKGSMSCRIESPPLMPGTYLIDLYFGDQNHEGQDLDVVHEAISFEVVPADVFGTGKLPPRSAGPIYWPAHWDLRVEEGTCRATT